VIRQFLSTAALAACFTSPVLIQAPAALAAAYTPPPPSSIGDPVAGAKAFAVCRACHQIGPGAHIAVGPVLSGVVGRPAGSYPGYNYSNANKHSGIVWTVEELEKYLAGPQKVVPGTKMAFAGYPNDPTRVKNIVAFLDTYNEDGSKKQ
jgi:cytochrome c